MPNCTLEEAWSGVKPTVKNLRVFGSTCYKYTSDERKKKLDDISEMLILVEYHSAGAYRMYDPRKNQIIMSKDFIVDEENSFDWKTTEAEPDFVQGILEDNRAEKKQVVGGNEGNNRRSQRARFPSTRLSRHEVFPDRDVLDSGDFAHLAFLVDA